MPGGKERAVARCGACGYITSVRVWEDGTVHPIGQTNNCCEGASYEVIEE